MSQAPLIGLDLSLRAATVMRPSSENRVHRIHFHAQSAKGRGPKTSSAPRTPNQHRASANRHINAPPLLLYLYSYTVSQKLASENAASKLDVLRWRYF